MLQNVTYWANYLVYVCVSMFLHLAGDQISPQGLECLIISDNIWLIPMRKTVLIILLQKPHLNK